MNGFDDIIRSIRSTEQNIKVDAENIQMEAKALQEYRELLDRASAMLEEAKEYASANNIEKILASRSQGPEPDPFAHKQGGKPNVQVLQEILELHGKPMYIDNLLYWAQKQGITFKGDNDPRLQLRNSLNGAKTRFWNVGNNTWWLVGQPIADEETRANVQ